MEFLESNWGAILGLLVNIGVLKYVLIILKNKFDDYQKRAEARDDATKSLCRTQIISICHKAQREGHIAYYNLENLTLLYKSYKALGGNGAAEKMYNKTINLPQIEEE